MMGYSYPMGQTTQVQKGCTLLKMVPKVTEINGFQTTVHLISKGVTLAPAAFFFNTETLRHGLLAKSLKEKKGKKHSRRFFSRRAMEKKRCAANSIRTSANLLIG